MANYKGVSEASSVTSNSKKKILSEQKVKERFQSMQGERVNWEPHWQDIADYINPRKNDITASKTPGAKRNFQVFDNTGMQACELLAGGLHGMLTNPASIWFEFTTGDKKLDEQDDVRKWLQDSSIRVTNTLNQTNFQAEVHELYLDLVSFCTAPMLILEDDEYIVRFQSCYVKEVYIEENERGLVDEIYRKWSWTPKQIIAFFGLDAVPDMVKEKWKAGKNDQLDILHAVYKQSDELGDMAAPAGFSHKYVSHYILLDTCYGLKVSGFAENPWVVPRWSKAAGEVYGRGPGMVALPEIKTINAMTETMIRGAQKTIDPPLQAPDDGFVHDIRTYPGSINYYRSGSNGKDRIEPIYNNAHLEFGFQMTQAHRGRIREAFYIDQLQLQDGPQMTATEVNQRTEEKMRLLGPLLGRMQSEFLRPMIDRVFAIMLRRNKFLPIPQALRGKNLDVQYSSFIAKLQRESQAANIQKTVAAAQPFVAVSPQVMDNVDPDKVFRGLASIFGFPQDFIRDQKDVDGMRKSRADAQAAQEKAQAAMQQAQAIGQAGPAVAQLQTAQNQAPPNDEAEQ